MSCRVLMRGVEEALMNLLMQDARDAGVETIIGEYIATPRNALVADLYSRLGFVPIEVDARGVARYSANPASYTAGNCFLEVRRSHS